MSEHPIAQANQLVRVGKRFRYRLHVEYDGTDFSGMQWQPDRRTVQQSLEDALEKFFEAKVRIIPSSRTDAGVHASGQVVHVDVPVQRKANSIIRAGNVALPNDIRITAAEEVDENFHARFSARWRGYEYRISKIPVALERRQVWQVFHPIDEKCLQELAQQIIGVHVFSAFSHENPIERHNYESTVMLSSWDINANQLIYRIHASRFLHGMVRLLVGTMLDISSSRGNAKSLSEILETKDNQYAGTKAPACGLKLDVVGYRDWPKP